MEERSLLIHEEVWGSDDIPNPLEIKVSMGQIGVYGSYLNGFPVYKNKELQAHYSCLKEFAQWAIENRVCHKCRYPWYTSEQNCECGKYEANKILMDHAIKSATVIMDFDHQDTLNIARQMEEALAGDSEYAQLNRKARVILNKHIERYNVEKPQEICNKTTGKIKKNWKSWFRGLLKWLKPSYWIWRFTTTKAERVKSIPIYAATEEEIKVMSFGNKTTDGNCCVRTKSGSVVVVPAGMVGEFADKHKEAEIVAPAIKS